MCFFCFFPTDFKNIKGSWKNGVWSTPFFHSPLHTMRIFFINFTFDVFMVNIVGNIVMFMPWGFGLRLLWRKNRHFSAVILYSIALPVLIETSQLFIGRNVDVDDLILNFAGSCLGAGLCFLLQKVIFRNS